MSKVFNKLGFTPLLRENFHVAVNSIKTTRLRSVLTILIIAIGITSLIGILTATDSIKVLLKENFGKMGANSFTIRSQFSDTRTSARRSRIINNRNITISQALDFKENYRIPSITT
ncbi:MAG: ABC transporter permease, partial [Bacteroidales bacterium]|nr:ABC transporter permease [Bacteroidales bacterium]